MSEKVETKITPDVGESKVVITGGKKLILGIHVNKDVVLPKYEITDHIKSAIKEAEDHGVSLGAIQIFAANPRSGKAIIEPETTQYNNLKTFIQNNPQIQFVIHSPYTTTALWNDAPYAGHVMRRELKMCDDLGILGVVIHLDSHGVDDVVKHLVKIIPKLPTQHTPGLAKVYLESAHVKPNKSHYETPEKVAKLFEAVRKYVDPHLNRVGFTIDTAHLHSCGVDLSSAELAAKWIKGMEMISKVLPPENIIIHLNGSLKELGDGLDAHAELAASDDKMWGKYKNDYAKSGLSQFVAYAKDNGIPCILERRHAHMYYPDYKLLYENEASVRTVNKKEDP